MTILLFTLSLSFNESDERNNKNNAGARLICLRTEFQETIESLAYYPRSHSG